MLECCKGWLESIGFTEIFDEGANSRNFVWYDNLKISGFNISIFEGNGLVRINRVYDFDRNGKEKWSPIITGIKIKNASELRFLISRIPRMKFELNLNREEVI